jgi:hypothetical protein
MTLCKITNEGIEINNCNASDCEICTKRKQNKRYKQLLTKFNQLQNDGYTILAISIEPNSAHIESIPANTTNPDKISELIKQTKSLTRIKTALNRKLNAKAYYYQLEFSNKQDPYNLHPHAHGLIAIESNNKLIPNELVIQTRRVHIQLATDISGWINYTFKREQHIERDHNGFYMVQMLPEQLHKKRIKVFTQSKV